MTRCLALLLALFCASAEATRVGLVADLNGRYGSTTYHERVDRAVETLISAHVDAVVCAGDMVAGQSQPRLDADWLDSMWAGFTAAVHEPLSRADIPFLVTAGNHDGSGLPAFGLERERFEVQWQSRRPALEFLPGSEWPRRYAVMMDGVLFLTFDGTVPGKLPPAETRFIERMLTAHSAAASATVVFSHLPMWPFTRGREDDILDDSNLLSMLHRGGVDVYVSGHHHAFYAGTDIAGMVHVSVGALGGNMRPLVGAGKKQPHGYAVLEISDQGIEVQSRVARSFSSPVPASDLPERLSGPLGSLDRLDGAAPLRPVSGVLR